MSDDEYIEIRCLWQQTDYKHISLLMAQRGYGGRERGSYQDRITDDIFAKIRDREHFAHPEWPIAENVITVSKSSIEALFPEVPIIEAIESEDQG